MIEHLTSRSRREEYLRCPRARWLLHEAAGTGYELLKQAIPLVTGRATHAGLAALLEGWHLDVALTTALQEYESETAGRGFDLDELEGQSFVYNEQKALVEALLRLASLRVIPALLAIYEPLEVEKMDRAILYADDHREIVWRSIPDALLREKATGDLYLLSWKTIAQYGRISEASARVDMQGMSEIWAIESRLDEKIRGIQMAYLVKGERQKREIRDSAGEIVEIRKETRSPLIRGYYQPDSFPIQYALDRFYTCQSAHPFRYAKGGTCPGGKTHKRGDDWRSFSVWEGMGVAEWFTMLDDGRVALDGRRPLDEMWALPMPFYRQAGHVERWLRQTRSAEIRVADDLERISETSSLEALDETFPQNNESCERWFGRKCPAWEICWGPDHVAADPVGSGLYQIRKQKLDVEVEA